MELPKVKKRKLINKKEFVEIAKKVRKSWEEEARYLHEQKILNENNLSS